MAKSKSIQNKNKWIIASVVVLALLTPFTVKFITQNQTTTKNYAAPLNTGTVVLNNPEITPRIGDTVTFDVNYTGNIKNPRFSVVCYIGNDLVYGEGGSLEQARGDGTDDFGYKGFMLGGAGSIWLYNRSTEPAQCVATLFYFGKEKGKQTYNPIASTSFSALGRQ